MCVPHFDIFLLIYAINMPFWCYSELISFKCNFAYIYWNVVLFWFQNEDEHVFKKPVLIAWKLFKSEAIGGLKSPFVFITVKSMQKKNK